MFYNTHVHTAAMVSKSKYDFHRMLMIWICMLKKMTFYEYLGYHQTCFIMLTALISKSYWTLRQVNILI